MSRRPSEPYDPNQQYRQHVPSNVGHYPRRSTDSTHSMGPPPLRPERSLRRPVGNSPSPALGGHPEGISRFPDGDRRNPAYASNGPTRSSMQSVGMTRNESVNSLGTDEGVPEAPIAPGSKSRRMMENLNLDQEPEDFNSPAFPSSSKLTSTAQFASNTLNLQSAHRRHSDASNSSAGSTSRPASPVEAENAAMGNMTLTDAISAFSNGGVRRDGRRGGLADQGFNAKQKAKTRATALNPSEYPDTPAFREIESVLRKVAHEWPVLMYGTPQDDVTGGTEREFDPVSLALSLLDSNSAAGLNSLPAFLRMKSELDHAITSTLNSATTSYRAYETSITTHNSTLQSLGTSQRQVGDLKKTLTEAREKLEGKGREGLVGMYNRLNHLEEMIKILDEIDHFRSIPDRLESLLSEKRFLTAVVLLMRSLKTINKPEMLEIGALTDLRAWLNLQEGVLLEILIEELHNHLYLKSFYCDVRWKSYTRGQTTLPQVDFGDDAENLNLDPSFHTSGRSTARLPRLTKLQRYLNYLSLRPSVNPINDEPVDDSLDSQTSFEENSAGYDETGSFSAQGGGGGTSASTLGESANVNQKKRPSKNPELDSFGYMEMLMESLAVLGKLGYGLDAITQRVQAEMYSLVESTIEEVEERNSDSARQTLISNRQQTNLFSPNFSINSLAGETPRRTSLASLSAASLSHGQGNRSSLLRLTASETTALEVNTETLKDLFWTLYSKLDAVLQGFRVTYEVSIRIAERRDFKDSGLVKSASGNLLFSLLDVWRPVQQEVRSLLHDYLTDDQTGTVSSRNPIVSVNEVLRLAKPRDATKQIFKFTDSDLKASSKALKAYEDDLNKALKMAVPGLMMDTTAANLNSALVMSNTTAGNEGARGSSAVGNALLVGTHKALVQADAFNVSVLFGPTLSFLERVKDIMPGGLMGEEDAFAAFLDEFVLKTFLPQLEEKVSSVFHQAVGGLDAFQEDSNYKKHSNVPIVKSVGNLMLLISNLCSMLRATPFHRESYSHLIVNVIHQFYQRCHDRFKDLAAREFTDAKSSNGVKSVTLKTSATWANSTDLDKCLLELRIPNQSEPKLKELLKKETKLEFEKKRNQTIEISDLITPSKKLVALGNLYSSLDWFITNVAKLKSATPDSGHRVGWTPASAENSPDLEGTEEGFESSTQFTLPLTPEMTKPFDALLKSYRNLANLVLNTLRLEIRLRVFHYLDKATRDGVYQLAEDIAEPDPSIVDLNSELAECDEIAATTLAAEERNFLFQGISSLMDQLLVTNSRYIRLANQFGLSKMQRNILALQQNLKNLSGDEPLQISFEKSRTFWELFAKTPKELLESIKTGKVKYEFEDYKSLLNLMCGIDQSSKDNTTAATAGEPVPMSAGGGDKNRRMYNEYLIDLFALDVGSNDEED